MAQTHETIQTTPDTAPAHGPAGRGGFRWRRWFWGTLLLAALLFALYTWFTLTWSYSEGERAGNLQKFSKKGWVCKTWEGELALYIVGGMAPQIWHFSVRDDAVAERLLKVVGQNLRLEYEEHVGVPTDCFGETGYYVTSFEVVDTPADTVPSVVPPPVALPPSASNP